MRPLFAFALVLIADAQAASGDSPSFEESCRARGGTVVAPRPQPGDTITREAECVLGDAPPPTFEQRFAAICAKMGGVPIVAESRCEFPAKKGIGTALEEYKRDCLARGGLPEGADNFFTCTHENDTPAASSSSGSSKKSPSKSRPSSSTRSPSWTSGPSCKKGCPCGNACIDCSKKCRK